MLSEEVLSSEGACVRALLKELQAAIFVLSLPDEHVVAMNETFCQFWQKGDCHTKLSSEELTLERILGVEAAAEIRKAFTASAVTTLFLDIPVGTSVERWEFKVERSSTSTGEYVIITSRLHAAWQRLQAFLSDCCENFTLFFDSLPGLVCLKDGEGRWLAANQAVIRKLKLEGLTYRGLTSAEIAELRPLYRDMLLGCMEKEALVWQTGHTWREIESFSVPDGQIVRFEVIRRPLYYPDGRRKYLLVLAQDVTEKLQALEALEHLESRYCWLLEQMRDAVYIILDYKLVFVNSAFSKLVGYPMDEILGQEAKKFVAPEDRERVFSFYQRRLNGEAAPLEYSLNLLHREGRRIPVDLSVTIIHFQGKIAVMGTLKDASIRLASEELARRQQEMFRKQHQALVRMSTHPALAKGDLETGLAVIAQLTAEVLDVGRVGIWRVDPYKQVVHCLVQYAAGEWEKCRGEPLALEAYPHYSAALYAGLLLDVEDVRQDPRTEELTVDYWERYGILSSIEVPVRIHGEVHGILCCESTILRKWQPDESGFAGQVAELIAQAFLSADLRRKTQALEVEKASLEMLYRLSHQLNSSLVFREVAQRALDELCSFFQGTRGLLLTMTRSGKWMELTATTGYDQQGQALLREFIAGRGVGMQGWVAESRQAMFIEDVKKDARWAIIPGLDEDIRAVISVPLLRGESLLGILTICSPEQGFFQAEHLKLLESAAATIAIALNNARLFESERAEREWAEALETAASLVNRSLNLDEVLDRILEQVSRVVPGDTFNVMLVEGKTARVVRWLGYDYLGNVHPSTAKPIPLERYPNLMRMLRTGEPVVIGDTMNTSAWIKTVETEWRRSYVAAPIQVNGETVGFLNVNGVQPDQFDDEDAQRLKVFTAHVAMAIQHARHFQQQVRYSEELEQLVQQRTEELAAKTNWLEAVLESTTDGIVVVDETGQIMLSNSVAQRWLQQSLSPMDAEQLRNSIHLLSREHGGQPTSVLLALTGLDLELSAALVQHADGGAPATVIVLHDVTHLKALERMKSEFISNVSHELRTPVTSIRLYVNLLQRHSKNCAPRYLDALERDSARLVDLVSDILEISRIDSGRLGLSPKDTDLDGLVTRILEAHHLLFENRQLSLEMHLSLGGEAVWLDAEKVTHVLNNVIDNAINYTPPGGLITVKTYETQKDSRRWAVVEVADTGIGIPEDELPHIFERFFRGQEPQKQQIQGSGLGLAIVKEIVALHGGYVRVHSKVGQGTTFFIGFPLGGKDSGTFRATSC